jgi:hypothetical protein
MSIKLAATGSIAADGIFVAVSAPATAVKFIN